MKTWHEWGCQFLRANRQIILYLFFGVCTTIINTVCYTLFYTRLGLSNALSTALAWLIAVVIAFLTNRIYVLQSEQAHWSRWVKEFVSFIAFRVLTGLLDIGIMVFAVDRMGWNGIVWKLISNIIVTISNYIASKYWIFH